MMNLQRRTRHKHYSLNMQKLLPFIFGLEQCLIVIFHGWKYNIMFSSLDVLRQREVLRKIRDWRNSSEYVFYNRRTKKTYIATPSLRRYNTINILSANILQIDSAMEWCSIQGEVIDFHPLNSTETWDKHRPTGPGFIYHIIIWGIKGIVL